MDKSDDMLRARLWPALKKELVERTKNPAYHPSFVFFFIVAILGIGPTGVWIELFNYLTTYGAKLQSFRDSLVSFVPAFATATAMQLIWAENAKRSLRAVAIFTMSLCMLGLIFCKSSAFIDAAGITFGVLSALLAMWLWWIANANQPEFKDEPPGPDLGDNAVGGANTDVELTGSLDGFQV